VPVRHWVCSLPWALSALRLRPGAVREGGERLRAGASRSLKRRAVTRAGKGQPSGTHQRVEFAGWHSQDLLLSPSAHARVYRERASLSSAAPRCPECAMNSSRARWYPPDQVGCSHPNPMIFREERHLYLRAAVLLYSSRSRRRSAETADAYSVATTMPQPKAAELSLSSDSVRELDESTVCLSE
jgi:hypothetical protein